MFRRTLIRHAQEARKPMIRFPDRKQTAHKQEEQHPHPEAPKQVVENFGHFKEVFDSGPHFHPEKLEASSSSSSSSPSSSSSSAPSAGKGGGEIFEDLHELPQRFWQTPSLVMGQIEMDAIDSGGATLT
ncbi:hypothetical protein CBS101457_003797 [Exobasidium rhododendri]|nr:hypothetical protein CBS101457_003797 [Exobasidium rhododendri]